MRLLAYVPIVATAACSIFGNAPPADIRYYDVDAPERAAGRRAAASDVELTLGSVRSSEFLRNHVVYRDSDDALREYDTARWTEYPEVYMRRALTKALYDGGPFLDANDGDAPVLDVELLAFEEVRRADGGRAGRVQIAYRLRRDDHVLASDTVTVERSAAEGTIPSVVDSLEDALAGATGQVAAAVQAALAQPTVTGRRRQGGIE